MPPNIAIRKLDVFKICVNFGRISLALSVCLLSKMRHGFVTQIWARVTYSPVMNDYKKTLFFILYSIYLHFSRCFLQLTVKILQFFVVFCFGTKIEIRGGAWGWGQIQLLNSRILQEKAKKSKNKGIYLPLLLLCFL